jgi:alanine dehydrogenase
MLVGVPKEIKDNEYRVGLVPSTVRELADKGHHVIVETNAGLGAGLADADYEAAGAEIVADADAVFARAEMIVKVKEPLAPERRKLKAGQILFTYLHLAPDRVQTEDLMAAGVTAIAYETVTSPQGTLPLLTPMSEVAGRMAPHAGARCPKGERRAVCCSAAYRVPPADVVIRRRVPAAMPPSSAPAWARPSPWSTANRRRSGVINSARGCTVFSTRDAVEAVCRRADLVIGNVLIPAAAPKLISAATVKAMKLARHRRRGDRPGRLCGDPRPTTHSNPTYLVDDVVHYCVTNMPGAVARTSTFALNNGTLPFVLALADDGWRRALGLDPHLRNGLNVHQGQVTHRAVADALKLKYTPAEAALRL